MSEKKPIYKKWWFWVIIVVIVIVIAGALGGSGQEKSNTPDVKPENTVETPKIEEKEKDQDIPAEYKSALKKAQSYSDMMHMSKSGLYDQLTSEYGENFSAEAAQYAIDNVNADWKANALKKANDYQDKMAMSPSAIYDQLISEYGEGFTVEEADYAIENLDK